VDLFARTGDPDVMDTEWSDLAERTEAVAMERFVAETDANTRTQLGMETRRVGDGVLTTVLRDPMGGYWNKALGFTHVVSDDLLAEIVQAAELSGVPALAIQVQPRCEPESFAASAGRLGIQQGSAFVKCFGPAEPRDVETDGLRVERIGADRADAFQRIMHAGFQVEPTDHSRRWFGDPAFFEGDWATYAAFDGDEPVAVARLLVVAETESGAMFGAATMPAARGRGAQNALLDARIREARDRGCRFASAETWAETPGSPNPSQHNMRHAGLTEVHVRRNWVLRRTRG
jgi:GNAT superfamily N-acetyltransferase